jgi:hypothetical protein
MSEFTHCRECGRRLRDAIFCPRCRQWLCSGACLDEHGFQHGAVVGTARDVPFVMVREITIGESPTAGRERPRGSIQPRGQ